MNNGYPGGPGGNGYGGPPSPSPYGVAPQGYAQPYGQPQQPWGGFGAPQQYGQPMQMYAQPIRQPIIPPKNNGLAIVLELLGGSCFQTFGIGHLYAGNVGMGLGLMFGYWALAAINFALCFVVVGFVTWPITWVAFMVISAITANNAVKEANTRAGFVG